MSKCVYVCVRASVSAYERQYAWVSMFVFCACAHEYAHGAYMHTCRRVHAWVFVGCLCACVYLWNYLVCIFCRMPWYAINCTYMSVPVMGSWVHACTCKCILVAHRSGRRGKCTSQWMPLSSVCTITSRKSEFRMGWTPTLALLGQKNSRNSSRTRIARASWANLTAPEVVPGNRDRENEALASSSWMLHFTRVTLSWKPWSRQTLAQKPVFVKEVGVSLHLLDI